ncbi:MAG: hypothetical protein RG740_04070, partial [Acholeplasmataceae bacterium]|nr:hypothetical protein [Acholeplasmataceae bacterium]
LISLLIDYLDDQRLPNVHIDQAFFLSFNHSNCITQNTKNCNSLPVGILQVSLQKQKGTHF